MKVVDHPATMSVTITNDHGDWREITMEQLDQMVNPHNL